MLFQGEDLTAGNPNFWDELFLLKPKIASMEAEIQKMSPGELIAAKENINKLFSQCVENLGFEHHIRIVYALQVYKLLPFMFTVDFIFMDCISDIMLPY